MTRKGAPHQVSIDGKFYEILNWAVVETEPLAQRISQGTLTQADRLNERIEPYPTAHLGFGLGEIRDDSDKGRYHYSKGVDLRFRGQGVLGPQLSSTTFASNAESKTQFIEFNGTWFSIGTRYIHSLSGTVWSVDKDFGATATHVKGSAVVFGNSLYVGAGNTDDFWARDTAGTWTQPAAGIKAQLFALVGQTLWLVFNSNQLRSSTNGTTWATAVSVGDGNRAATLLTDYNGNPLVGKPEGLFEYDGSKVSNRLPELAYRQDSENCRGGKPSRGKLFLPVGPGFWTYTADAIQTEAKPTRSAEVIAPGALSRESSTEVRGPIKDLWPDIDFLYGIMAAQSGTYYIVCYDFNPTSGQGWHQLTNTGTTAVTALGRFDSGSSPKMYYSEGTTIKYFLLPKNTINPFADTTYLYGLTGDAYLPVMSDVFDDTQKAYLSLLVNADGISATKYVEFFYTIDNGTETSLGRITTTGWSTIYFPLTVSGRRISFRMHFVTDDATVTPRILTFSRHYQMRFERKRRWTFTVVGARKSIPNSSKPGTMQLTDLESARNTVTPVTFIDPYGQTWTAFVDKMGEGEFVNDGSDDLVLEVKMELLEWRSGGGINRWNSATIYDENANWSNGTDNFVAYWS